MIFLLSGNKKTKGPPIFHDSTLVACSHLGRAAAEKRSQLSALQRREHLVLDGQRWGGENGWDGAQDAK